MVQNSLLLMGGTGDDSVSPASSHVARAVPTLAIVDAAKRRKFSSGIERACFPTSLNTAESGYGVGGLLDGEDSRMGGLFRGEGKCGKDRHRGQWGIFPLMKQQFYPEV